MRYGVLCVCGISFLRVLLLYSVARSIVLFKVPNAFDRSISRISPSGVALFVSSSTFCSEPVADMFVLYIAFSLFVCAEVGQVCLSRIATALYILVPLSRLRDMMRILEYPHFFIYVYYDALSHSPG